MTLFWRLYCQLSTDFTHCSVSTVDFERVNASWVSPDIADERIMQFE